MSPTSVSSYAGGVVKPAGPADRRAVQRLVESDPESHRHLGWIPPLEWLGQEPFLLLEGDRQIRGVLACPPDQADRCWLRLFASGRGESREEVWEVLWAHARQILEAREGVEAVHGLVLGEAMEKLLRASGFAGEAEVVVLDWEVGQGVMEIPVPDVDLRILGRGQSGAVADLDQRAFAPLWQNTEPQIERSLREAAFAVGVFQDDKLVGFQISTAGALSGHLARLAVDPAFRGKGIGKALVADALDRFVRRGMVRVTVNTQADNTASLEIYRQFGFVLGEDRFPVLTYSLNK